MSYMNHHDDDDLCLNDDDDDDQGERSPTVFPLRRGNLLTEDLRLDSLKRNRMFGGYDLNSGTDILREEEEVLGLIGMNDGFPHLPHHHPLRRLHMNINNNNKSNGNNNNNKQSSGKNCNLSSLKTSCAGITIKPIYQSRVHHPSFLSNESRDDISVPSQTTIYPYQLPRLSPIERQKIYFSGRHPSSFPGTANIFVNDSWMVVPLESLATTGTFSSDFTSAPPSYRLRTSSLNGSEIHATVSSRSTSCEGCRRHSCPPPPQDNFRQNDKHHASSSDEEKSSCPSEGNNNFKMQQNRLSGDQSNRKGTYTKRTSTNIIHIEAKKSTASPSSSPVNKDTDDKQDKVKVNDKTSQSTGTETPCVSDTKL